MVDENSGSTWRSNAESWFKAHIRPIFTNFWGFIAGILLTGASGAAVAALLADPDCRWLFLLTAGLWALWALFPPFFFLMQWTAFEGDDKQLERMRYSQELASKFWIGGVGVLSAILLHVDQNADRPSVEVVIKAYI